MAAEKQKVEEFELRQKQNEDGRVWLQNLDSRGRKLANYSTLDSNHAGFPDLLQSQNEFTDSHITKQ